MAVGKYTHENVCLFFKSGKSGTRTRRNVQVGDIKLIVDYKLPRSSWPLG